MVENRLIHWFAWTCQMENAGDTYTDDPELTTCQHCAEHMRRTDDELREITKKYERKVTADLFSGASFTTATATAELPALNAGVLDRLVEVSRELSESRENEIVAFIVTKMPIQEGGLKCHYEGEWYMLISQSTWLQLKKDVPSSPYQSFFSTLMGVPVFEDDKLARLILTSAFREVAETMAPVFEAAGMTMNIVRKMYGMFMQAAGPLFQYTLPDAGKVFVENMQRAARKERHLKRYERSYRRRSGRR